MADELKNILSNLNKDIDQEKLLQYLNRELPDAQQHAIEQQLNDDSFMSDAMEGLQQVNDTSRIHDLVHELNNNLKKQTEKKNKRKEKRRLKDHTVLYIAIFFIIVMAIVAYMLIKKMGQ